MGKHSSDSQLPFIRSVVGWFLPWFLVAIVVAVGVWVAVDALGGDDLSTPRPAAAGSSSASPRTTPSPDVTSSATATPEPKGSKEAKLPEDDPEPEELDLITEGITVQVLNGTSFPAADDEMADQLASLGFDVLAVAGSSKAYPATTVFYSYPEAEEAGERLAARFGWAVSIKPSNLSATVDLHVIVGDDYL